MPHIPPRHLDPKELAEILEALDAIFGLTKPSPAPPPMSLDASELPKTWEPPAPPPRPRPAQPVQLPSGTKKEKTLPPTRVKTGKTLPPHKPAGPLVPPFPPESVPAGAQEQARRLAVFYTQGCEQAIARLVGYLDEIGRKCKSPIYLTKCLVEQVTADTHPKAMSLKARVQEAAAAVGMLHGLSQASRAEWEAAMKKDRVRFHLVEPEQAGDRSLLIEVMSGLLVFDPKAPREYGWEDHGHDEEHGKKREPWR